MLVNNMKSSAKFKFEDNSVKFLDIFNECSVAFLEEVKDSLVSQTQRNTPVETGGLKRSFGDDSFVDKDELTAYIGSSKKYAIWVEKGTGEYAIEGNGRKDGWVYQDEKGNFHRTKGRKPKMMLYQAYITKKAKISKEAAKHYRRLNQK